MNWNCTFFLCLKVILDLVVENRKLNPFLCLQETLVRLVYLYVQRCLRDFSIIASLKWHSYEFSISYKSGNIYSFLPVSCCLLTHSRSFKQASSRIFFVFLTIRDFLSRMSCQVSNAMRYYALWCVLTYVTCAPFIW